MEEFETYCADYLPGVLEYQKAHGWLPSTETINDLKNQILAHYDGYSWDGINRVLNPYSLIKLLEIKELDDFWFNTGTPTFLLEFIRGHLTDFSQTENSLMTKNMLGAVDVANLELVPLLFQTGYLTIDKRSSSKEYILKYPNLEVEQAFNINLLKFLSSQSQVSITALSNDINTALLNFDSASLAGCFKKILTWFPYEMHLSHEAYYHSIIFAVLKSFHYKVFCEFSKSDGVVDMSIEIPNGPIFICGFKYAKIPKIEGQSRKKNQANLSGRNLGCYQKRHTISQNYKKSFDQCLKPGQKPDKKP
jgi:hypothetical protein